MLCRPGLGGGSADDWVDLLEAGAAVMPRPSAYLVSLGSNALAQVDAGDDDELETLQVTLRAGLTRLVTTLRAVASRCMVIVMSPVPRAGLSELHIQAFDAASQMCEQVAAECGGHFLAVCDVVSEALVGGAGNANRGAADMPPTAYDGSGNHLSYAAGVAVANAVQDIVLGTLPDGVARRRN